MYLRFIPKNTDGVKLHTAIAYNDIATVRRLIEQGVSPDTPGRNGYPPLLAAISEGDLIITELLLDAGADINTFAPGRGDNSRVLHRALREDIRLVQLLTDRGADVNGRDSNGSSPLHYAVLDDEKGVLINLLVDNGADVNARNNSDVTPLHWAASQGSYEVAKHLINRGADRSIRNTDGLTPADIAKTGTLTPVDVPYEVVIDEELVTLLQEPNE